MVLRRALLLASVRSTVMIAYDMLRKVDDVYSIFGGEDSKGELSVVSVVQHSPSACPMRLHISNLSVYYVSKANVHEHEQGEMVRENA